MLAIYINLARRTDRRAFMEAQFAALGLDVERLDATTPETIKDEDLAPCSRAEALGFLSPAEIAVSISHFRTWKQMLDRRHRRVLVLEDDLGLSRRLPSFLAELDTEDPELGILRIETHLDEVLLHGRPERGPPGFSFHLPLSFESGAGAYIMSAAAARRILASPQRFSLPLDDILFSLESPFRDGKRLRVAVPALAIYRYADSPEFRVPVSILQSDTRLDRDMRGARTLAPRLAAPQKIRREIRRIGRQVVGALPAIRTYLTARRTVVPFADGAFSGPPSASPPLA